jgi:hypothetical protein
MEHIKYLIFFLAVLGGVALSFLSRGFFGFPLMVYGLDGLSVSQQMSDEELRFQRELILRELAEKERQAEFERQMQILRLQRPATPDEGY